MSQAKRRASEIIALMKSGVRTATRLMAKRRPSKAWLIAAFLAFAAAVRSTSVRVPNSYLDVAGLQVLIVCALLAATTCFLVAFRVRSRKTYRLAWFSVMVAFVCCVVVT
jgi:hypothetical protein